MGPSDEGTVDEGSVGQCIFSFPGIRGLGGSRTFKKCIARTDSRHGVAGPGLRHVPDQRLEFFRLLLCLCMRFYKCQAGYGVAQFNINNVTLNN